MFENKTLLITGGTGSFGNAVLDKFLDSNLSQIRIFSRDEKKQDDMRKKYNNSKIKYYVGDVRDYRSLEQAMVDVDFVFHAAALKQVPSCEFYPMQAVKTNIFGTENVLLAAINQEVKKVICLSTDKAVYPINAMGISKAMMEKVMVATSRITNSNNTIICGTRYGNVMASRGSVIPLIVNQVLAGDPVTITDPSMTRFMMSLDDAVDLVIHAFQNGSNGEIYVQKSPAATLDTLIKAILSIMGKEDHLVKNIGIRHGEKLHEVLVSREELALSEESEKYFRIMPDDRDLNYEKYFEKGDIKSSETSHGEDFNSFNTKRLNLQEMKQLLMKLEIMRDL